MLTSGFSLTSMVNWGMILISVTSLPEVGIKIFSLSFRRTSFMFCAVADSDSVLTEIPLLLNSCFNPLINSVLSFSTAVASNIIILASGNWRVKCSYTSEYR